ncbi:MAG: hypothetical protein AB1642_10510 [Pseudomonadota bacterium]
MNKTTTLTLATGVAFAATVALAPAVQAAESPFGMTKLGSGYQLAAADDKKKDGKCGEGKCGGDKRAAEDKKMDDKKKDGSCGGDKKKDGSCGAKK